jgi:hypothetical protein
LPYDDFSYYHSRQLLSSCRAAFILQAHSTSFFGISIHPPTPSCHLHELPYQRYCPKSTVPRTRSLVALGSRPPAEKLLWSRPDIDASSNSHIQTTDVRAFSDDFSKSYLEAFQILPTSTISSLRVSRDGTAPSSGIHNFFGYHTNKCCWPEDNMASLSSRKDTVSNAGDALCARHVRLTRQ